MHLADRADLARGHPLARLAHHREARPRIGHPEEESPRTGALDEVAGVFTAGGERLVADDVRPRIRESTARLSWCDRFGVVTATASIPSGRARSAAAIAAGSG